MPALLPGPPVGLEKAAAAADGRELLSPTPEVEEGAAALDPAAMAAGAAEAAVVEVMRGVALSGLGPPKMHPKSPPPPPQLALSGTTPPFPSNSVIGRTAKGSAVAGVLLRLLLTLMLRLLLLMLLSLLLLLLLLLLLSSPPAPLVGDITPVAVKDDTEEARRGTAPSASCRTHRKKDTSSTVSIRSGRSCLKRVLQTITTLHKCGCKTKTLTIISTAGLIASTARAAASDSVC